MNDDFIEKTEVCLERIMRTDSFSTVYEDVHSTHSIADILQTTLKTLLVKNPSGKEELNTNKSTEELAERPVEQLEDLVALAA